MKENFVEQSAYSEKWWDDWIKKTGGYTQGDMTIRDHFAGLAMPEIYQRVETGGFERAAKRSYEMADAMLKERAK